MRTVKSRGHALLRPLDLTVMLQQQRDNYNNKTSLFPLCHGLSSITLPLAWSQPGSARSGQVSLSHLMMCCPRSHWSVTLHGNKVITWQKTYIPNRNVLVGLVNRCQSIRCKAQIKTRQKTPDSQRTDGELRHLSEKKITVLNPLLSPALTEKC